MAPKSNQPKLKDYKFPFLGALATFSAFTFLAYLSIPYDATRLQYAQAVPDFLRSIVPAAYSAALEQALDFDWLGMAYALPGVGKYGITIVKYTLLLHVLEAGYTTYLVNKHVSGVLPGLLYIGTTVLFGGPIWMSLLRRVSLESNRKRK